MIATPAISAAARGEEADVVAVFKPPHPHASSHVEPGVKRRLGLLIRHKLDAPEQATAADIADVGVRGESLTQQPPKEGSHLARVVDEPLVTDDALYLEGRHHVEWMALVRLAVLKGRLAMFEPVDDALVDQDGRDGAVAGGQAFADTADVRHDSFSLVVLLPGVHRARTAEPAHDLIENQQGAVSMADVLNRLQVAGKRCDAAQSRAHHGLGHEGAHISGSHALELGLKLGREPRHVVLCRLIGALVPVRVAGRDAAAVVVWDHVRKGLLARLEIADRQGAQRTAVP